MSAESIAQIQAYEQDLINAMATALASGFISASLVSSVIISDPNMSQLNRLRKQLNSNIVTLTQNNEDVCRSAQVVFLAIKPQVPV